MAFGIPMQSGDSMGIFNKAFGLDNILKQNMERQKLKQQGEQHKQALGQNENHFLQNLAIRKAQMEHARANDEINRQVAQQRLAHLKNLDDPMRAVREYEAMQNYYKGQGNPNANSGQMQPPMPVPQEQMGEGRGVFSPEGFQDAQQTPQMPANGQMGGGNPSAPPGVDLELMKQNPALRAAFKQKFKYDPLAEMSRPLQGPARNAKDMQRLKKEEGENSEAYQWAKAEYDEKRAQQQDLRDLRARTKAGLKAGEKEFFDPESGVPLGKEIPLTAKERESEVGNIVFNELYPYVYKGSAIFSGAGANSRLENAAANYKTDPKSRQMIDDLLLADKLMAPTAVNEATTLKAGHTNQAFKRLEESLKANDVPKLLKKFVKEYQIPASAQLRAGLRYQKILTEARKKGNKGAPATQRLFYNPEMQAKHEASVNGESGGNAGGKVIVIDPNGKRFETTAANAAHLPAGWSRG